MIPERNPGACVKVTLRHEESMGVFAQKMAPWLHAGDLLSLSGPVGVGKTTLVKALGKAFGIQSPITSPSFTLISEYPEGTIPLVHMDLYRMENPNALYEEMMTYLDAGTWLVAVEWAEVAHFLANLEAHRMTMSIEPDGSRLINVFSRSAALLSAVSGCLEGCS